VIPLNDFKMIRVRKFVFEKFDNLQDAITKKMFGELGGFDSILFSAL